MHSRERKPDSDGGRGRSGEGEPEGARSFAVIPHADWFFRFAWVPIPLFLAAILILWVVDPPVPPAEPRYLLPLLNFFFRTAIAGFIAYLAWRSFGRNGYLPILMLGCGMLFFGISSLVSGVAVYYGEINFGLTVYNTGMWLSGACHLVAGFTTFTSGDWFVRHARLVQTAAYTAILVVSGALAFAAFEGWTPVFFVEGEGPTQFRQMLLSSAIAMFALAAILIYTVSRRRNWHFGRGYALALGLIATGLFGIMLPAEIGSPLSWVGRSAQYLGAFYLLGATLLAARQSGEWDSLLENVLQESEHRFRTVVENSRDAIHQFDLRTERYVFVSPSMETLTGFTASEIMEMPLGRFFARVHPQDRKAIRKYFSQVTVGGSPDKPAEYRWRIRNGEYRWFSDSRGALRDADGKVVSLVGVSSDITARKLEEERNNQWREELEQRVEARTAELRQRADQLARLAADLTLTEQRERGRLARVLHDNLQQLLVAAKLSLNALSRKTGEKISTEITRIEELLNESINTSRSLTVELAPPILREGGLAAALHWLSRWARKQLGLHISARIDDSLAVDREETRLLLFQAVRELLLNVSKHAGVPEASVEFSRNDPDEVRVVVEDHGAGFDVERELMPRDDIAGGFGLFSIRERLDLLGGSLRIESAPGQGARFTITVPSRPERATLPESRPRRQPDPAVADRPPQALAPAADGRIRLLLADDHAMMRQGLSSLLGAEPDLAIVAEASNGNEAVELARRMRPDVILMDFSMPGLDGVQATRAIRNEYPEIRIIGLSMYEEADRGRVMLEAGADAYVNKSGKSEALLNTIRRLVCSAASNRHRASA